MNTFLKHLVWAVVTFAVLTIPATLFYSRPLLCLLCFIPICIFSLWAYGRWVEPPTKLVMRHNGPETGGWPLAVLIIGGLVVGAYLFGKWLGPALDNQVRPPQPPPANQGNAGATTPPVSGGPVTSAPMTGWWWCSIEWPITCRTVPTSPGNCGSATPRFTD